VPVVRVLLVIATLAGLALAGCGQSESTQRIQVAGYLNRVNAVAQQLTTPLTAVTQAAGQFAAEQSHGSGSPSSYLTLAHERTLVSAGNAIVALRQRLARIPAPPPALRLRSMLLGVVDRERFLSRQAAKLVVYLPGFRQALVPLNANTVALERVLVLNQALGPAAVGAVYAEKAAALRQFKASIGGVIAQLRRLDPPLVSRPGYTGQLRALEGMSSSAGRLAAALAGGNSPAVPPLLTEFNRAATSTRTDAAQRAQIDAIRNYDHQVAELSTLTREAEVERQRLATSLK
jgi:hypothetical protein